MAEGEKLLASNSEEEEDDDEEEALSLCDLPLNEENKCCKEILDATRMRENEEEFNFGSKESEMCAADEVFFKGQILPLRLSVSSESGLGRFQQESRNTSRCLSRSESMDHSSSTGSTSINSSRSSSTRSYYSSTTTTTTTTSVNSTCSKQQKIRNNFHSCPSPNPQIRVSSFRLSNVSSSSSCSRSQKSTIWDLFRIGLVRAPEIELQDLKLRNNNINGGNRSGCVSRNSSSGSSSNNSSCNNGNINNIGTQKDPNLEKKQTKKQNSNFEKRIGLFNLSGCKCSINAVETVPLNNNNIVVIKSGVGSSEELKIKKKKKKKKMTKKEEEKKQEGKQAMSRHRTFEWLKELSHGSYVVVDHGHDHHQ